MKIGILTMNYRRNYGGILQCVALQNTLKSWGYDVEVIKYSPKSNKEIYRKLKVLITDFSYKDITCYIHNFIADKINFILGKQKALPQGLLNNCAEFVSLNINYTELCNEDTIGELVNQHNYDAIIVGSDKIWGGLNHHQLVYMGDWTPRYEKRLISYAACSSQSHIPQFNQNRIYELLKRFYQISVRDDHTKTLFKDIPEINVQVVLDPTFLYDFKSYVKQNNDEPYIFTYILGREIRGGHSNVLHKIRERYGNIKIKAIVLSDESTDIVKYADEVYYEATPSDWINMIYNAKFIYTDSFHGIVFSLKFQKPFIAYYQEANRSTRLIDLKNRFGLNRNIVSSVDEVIINKSIDTSLDYSIINTKIEVIKQKSISFLQNALKYE